MVKQRFKRPQFAVVLVLAPLNNTFERKRLVVPFSPDALKLGRQTTARTAAAVDNGFFDSRVLSRQHAEIWAERESGKVWLRDCKSSNGTYINNRRLSPENQESEAFELQRNDELDLGIDIISNDESKQVYHRISAKVERISMMLLQNSGSEESNSTENEDTESVRAGPGSSDNAFVGEVTADSSSVPKQNYGIEHLQAPRTVGKLSNVSRKPSLETLKNVTTSSPTPEIRGGEAVFGTSPSLESLALNYASATAGGLLVKQNVKNHVMFELAAKRLVAQIRAVRADTAKLTSLTSLLTEIKSAAIEMEAKDVNARDRLAQERQKLDFERQQLESERKQLKTTKIGASSTKKSSSLAALKAENARFRAELAGMHSRNRTRSASPVGNSPLPLTNPSSPVLGDSNQDLPKVGEKLYLDRRQPTVAHARYNAIVLVATAVLVTVVGVLIMFFFNPPMAPRASPFIDMFNTDDV